MLINRRILVASTALCCSLAAAPRAGAQADTPAAPALAPALAPGATQTRPAAIDGDVAPEDVTAVRRLLDDEGRHRDRVARIRRLRELAQQANLREHLAQLDDLERRELRRHESRRLLERGRMSERSFRTADGFRGRGGILRLRRGATAQQPPVRHPGRSATPPKRPVPPVPVRPASQPPVRPAPRGGSPR